MFSEKSLFYFFNGSTSGALTWRQGQSSSNCEMPHGQCGIMVQGAIADDSRSLLVRILGTVTTQRYADDAL
ncbi:hypothetical protein NPIL_8821 [Nephila pilipes]|uniref:Uncharacterized protein n=1 Tax=Nephila pilipes TaxID=299642 RepID=A0A8X6NRA9_NEPPI|nr:hypothetical protein NPIL_8821 [Nephila pilipes]